MGKKPQVDSLQVQCCRAIGINSECYPEHLLDELSLPCLSLLVENLSMYDLLKLEGLLKRRGIDTKTAFYQLNQKLFMSAENFTIKQTQCPHLLDIFPFESQDWSLTKLLHRRTIALLVQEHTNCSGNKCHQLDSDMQALLIKRYNHLMELFCPPGRVNKDIVETKISRSGNLVKNLTIMAASKISFITVDVNTCIFFLESQFESILQAVFNNVVMVSLLLRNSSIIVEFLARMRKEAKQLERISIYGVKTTEMLRLDTVLSICSGVAGYYTTPEGDKERELLEQLISAECAGKDVKFESSQAPPEKGSYVFQAPSQSDAQSATYDLMDDALLFGTPCPPTKFDSESGLQKADFRFSNLVKIEYYTFVLNHHLRSWLSLQECRLGVQELHPETVKCLCFLLQRPQFRSFTLSTAMLKPTVVEDLLFAVASRRRSNPLEALCFVSLNEMLSSMDELFVTDQLITKSEEEVDSYVEENGSKRMAQLTGFHGTKTLEVSASVISVRTECVLNQFVAKDQALTSLCFSKSISRVMVQTILNTLTKTNKQIKSLILEQWHILRESSAKALTGLLQMSALSLGSLNLRGCITSRNTYNFSDIINAVTGCPNLKYIDFSNNNLGTETAEFVKDILSGTSITEISLKNNHLSKETVVNLLNLAAVTITRQRRRPLDILDLRLNMFVESDRADFSELLHDVARVVLLDYTFHR